MTPRRSSDLDKVDKRKQRALNSCLPCRQRKVKCDQQRPCQNCSKRGSVSECISTPARANEGPPLIPSPPTAPSSTLSAGSLQISSPPNRVHEDIIRPTIEQDASERPSLLYDDPEASKTFELSCADVMDLWKTYVNRIQLVTPLVLEPGNVESWMVQLTLPPKNLDPGQEMPGILLTQLDDYLPNLPYGSRALLLAVLASAAQFSSQPHLRSALCQRSLMTLVFRNLRMSNYLRNPTTDLIQALLLGGYVLQNDRASQAAWCLLGTTIRLAECIGVHPGLWKGSDQGYELAHDLKSKLLYRLCWQDGLLSMSLGRVPTIWLRGTPEIVRGKPMVTADAMVLMAARMGTTLWTLQSRRQDDFDTLLRHVKSDAEYIRQIVRSVSLLPVSFDTTCLSTGFAMHSSFVISYLCRPALKHTAVQWQQETSRLQVLEICKEHLVSALKNYVYLSSAWEFTIRSWSVAHSGLGAALMLGTLGEFKEESIRRLAATVIETLENRLEDVAIVSKGSKALALLKSLYDEATGQLAHDPRPPTLRVKNTTSSLDNRYSDPMQQGSEPTDGDCAESQQPVLGFEAPFMYSFAEPAALEEFDSLFMDHASFAWESWPEAAFTVP